MSERIPIAPMAAVNELQALKDFYENRVLVLANKVHELTTGLESAEAALKEARELLGKLTPSAEPVPADEPLAGAI